MKMNIISEIYFYEKATCFEIMFVEFKVKKEYLFYVFNVCINVNLLVNLKAVLMYKKIFMNTFGLIRTTSIRLGTSDRENVIEKLNRRHFINSANPKSKK
jgi:hypothetical protein